MKSERQCIFVKSMRRIVKRTIRILAILLLILPACTPQLPTAVNDIRLLSNLQVDTSKYVILKFNPKDTWLFKNAKSTSLSINEIQVIEEILKKCIDKYNVNQEKEYKKVSKEQPEDTFRRSDFLIDLSKHKRQYIPVITSKGEKEVWVNCLCDDITGHWKEEPVTVFDGGNCYFNLKINLPKKSYYNLMVNGVA